MIPDGPVLFDQSAQLGDQHPRPGRALRAHQRRHRAGRRSLHRRRLLRPSRRRRRSTSSTWSRSRCCADRRERSSARTRPPARSTSRPASPASRRKREFELNYGSLGFVQAKASITGPLVTESRRAAVLLRHPARRHASYNIATRRRRERSQQSGRQGPGAVRPVGQDRDHRGGGPHAPAPRRLYPGGRGRRAHAARREPAVRRRSPPISAMRLRASTPSTG